MKNCILSVCIPTYNRVKHLKRQVSFLEQYLNDEIQLVISDNCSSDGTSEFLKTLTINKYISANINTFNEGTESNMRKCSQLAIGEYIYFLGDDDYLSKDFIPTLIKLIKEYRADYYHFNYRAFDDLKMLVHKENGINRRLNIHNTRLNHKEIAKIVSRYYGPLLFISSNVFKRDIVINNIDNYSKWVETLRLSVISMTTGTTYIDDSPRILCGVNSSWTDRRGEVWFESFPKLFDNMKIYGFSDRDILKIKSHALADCIFNYYRSNSKDHSQKSWTLEIKKLSNARVKWYLFVRYCKKILHKLVTIVLFKQMYVPVSDKDKELYELNGGETQ